MPRCGYLVHNLRKQAGIVCVQVSTYCTTLPSTRRAPVGQVTMFTRFFRKFTDDYAHFFYSVSPLYHGQFHTLSTVPTISTTNYFLERNI